MTSKGTAADEISNCKSENIEVYISFNNPIQGNGKRLSELITISFRSLFQTSRCDETSYLSQWSILAVIESENVEVYLSLNKPIKRNGQKLLNE